MSVSNFIKENRVLVAGLALPFLLICLMAVAKIIPASLVEPPTQKVVYYSNEWAARGNLVPKIGTDGKIMMTFNENKGYTPNPNYNTPDPKTTLYLFNPVTGVVSQQTVTIDKDNKISTADKFTDLAVSSDQPSSDGYTFQRDYYGGNSIMTDIFWSRSRYYGPILVKNGRVVRIPLPTSPYYGTFEFLGWVKE